MRKSANDHATDDVGSVQGACDRNGPGRGIGRRKLLKRLGATGLAGSAAVFAGSVNADKASAAPNCCELANYPENTTYEYCSAHAAYIWYCSVDPGFLHCACCETKNNAKSAAHCQYN